MTAACPQGAGTGAARRVGQTPNRRGAASCAASGTEGGVAPSFSAGVLVAEGDGPAKEEGGPRPPSVRGFAIPAHRPVRGLVSVGEGSWAGVAETVVLSLTPRGGRDEVARAIGLRRLRPAHLLAVGPRAPLVGETVGAPEAKVGRVGAERTPGETTVAQPATQVAHRLTRAGPTRAATARVRAQTVRVTGAHRAAAVGVRHADVPAAPVAWGDQREVAMQATPMRRALADVGAPTVPLPPPAAPVVVVREGPATAGVAAGAGREGDPRLVAHGVPLAGPVDGGRWQIPPTPTPNVQLVRHDAVRPFKEPGGQPAPRHRLGLVGQAAPAEADVVLLVAAGRRALLPEVADVVEAKAAVAALPHPAPPRVAPPRQTVPAVPTMPVEEAIQVGGLRTAAAPGARGKVKARVTGALGEQLPLKERPGQTLGDATGPAPARAVAVAPLRPRPALLRRAQATVGVLPAPGRRPRQVLPQVETMACVQVATPCPVRPGPAAVRLPLPPGSSSAVAVAHPRGPLAREAPAVPPSLGEVVGPPNAPTGARARPVGPPPRVVAAPLEVVGHLGVPGARPSAIGAPIKTLVGPLGRAKRVATAPRTVRRQATRTQLPTAVPERCTARPVHGAAPNADGAKPPIGHAHAEA